MAQWANKCLLCKHQQPELRSPEPDTVGCNPRLPQCDGRILRSLKATWLGICNSEHSKWNGHSISNRVGEENEHLKCLSDVHMHSVAFM